MRPVFALIFTMSLAGCTTTSEIMDAGNGTYIIYGNAGSLRGGAVAASNVAFKSANAFCAKKSFGAHAIAISSQSRAAHPLLGETATADELFTGGNASLHFRCGR